MTGSAHRSHNPANTGVTAAGDQDPLVIDDTQLSAALHEMLESGGALTRALLGAGADHEQPPFPLPPGITLPPGLDIRAFIRGGILQPPDSD